MYSLVLLVSIIVELQFLLLLPLVIASLISFSLILDTLRLITSSNLFDNKFEWLIILYFEIDVGLEG